MRKRDKCHRNLKGPKSKLGLPDLEHAKTAVLNSLRSRESKRGYGHPIDEFVDWYCSEPRLSLNKTVVTRYRMHLEDRHLAPGTINGRLAAVRRLAYEAAEAKPLGAHIGKGRDRGPKRSKSFENRRHKRWTEIHAISG
ncbi:MAG: hypothetical protein ACR2IV_05300 [Bryobacteraceae bacterium]